MRAHDTGTLGHLRPWCVDTGMVGWARFGQSQEDDVTFEKLGGDFLFTEGPLWHPREKFLLWSDMPGDHLRRWSAREGVTTFRKPCNMSNGLAYDRQGRLVVCEHATSQL